MKMANHDCCEKKHCKCRGFLKFVFGAGVLGLLAHMVYGYLEEGIIMNKIAEFIKQNRKANGLTQEEFAIRSGLGLRFVRELEQGKETVRMDKVNVALSMFGMEAVPGRKEK